MQSHRTTSVHSSSRIVANTTSTRKNDDEAASSVWKVRHTLRQNRQSHQQNPRNHHPGYTPHRDHRIPSFWSSSKEIRRRYEVSELYLDEKSLEGIEGNESNRIKSNRIKSNQIKFIRSFQLNNTYHGCLFIILFTFFIIKLHPPYDRANGRSGYDHKFERSKTKRCTKYSRINKN